MQPPSPFLASLTAACEPIRRVRRPEIGIETTVIADRRVPVREQSVAAKPFCRLLHFERDIVRQDPRILVVAPLSGHFSALLRDLVASFIADHDVYLTDWIDARNVPVNDGRFGLDENIGYLLDFIRHLGGDLHLIGLCQSAMPALAATALLASVGESTSPRTLTLINGMLDVRINPTRIDRLAIARRPGWFERYAIEAVPPPFAGQGRAVYPASAQHAALLSYLARHLMIGGELLDKLLYDDGDDAARHPLMELFLSVMDLPAEFFLDAIRVVFRECALAQGQLTWRGTKVQPEAIRHTALMTIEGERDDVSGSGQTQVAHDLCRNIAPRERAHYVQHGVGHIGTFHGRACRTEVMPRIRAFIRGER